LGFDGRILDAQAVGVVGMDRSDDVIATVNNAGLRARPQRTRTLRTERSNDLDSV